MGARPSWSGLGAELEQLALRVGLKPALRGLVPAHRVARLRERVRGLALVEAELVPGTAVVYAAREAERAAALRDAEAPVLPGRRPSAEEAHVAHREVGRLLGYPRCCVKAYLVRLARGVEVRRDGTRAAEALVAAEDAILASRVRHARLNGLVSRPLVPFVPCRLDCPSALRYADALFAALAARRHEDAEALRAALLEPVRLRRDGSRLDPREPEPATLELTFDAF